ncbi:hypothetical protein [Tropicimonas sp. IMCC6043]|uniref:DUF6931 family protein n=1 Tax=Tropicimonas sp. IMCC6043 TaxID=2510645 RepID=UPI00101D383D|nr:hypothetical protein [Tropicimonas sp. IMCC6043]RYH09352.1 hypothetical protein EU800_13120 [Tropicimonas sp. IMCC6043]
MSDRFEGLKKIPEVPAARLLAGTNLKLDTKLESPASAGVSVVLAELASHEAAIDMIKLIAASLPPREAVWWGCLAMRDVLGPDVKPTPCLKAAEAWVFKPSEETQAAAHRASEAANPTDDSSIVATMAVFGQGTLGPGDLKEHPAPDGAVAAMAAGVNLMALEALGGDLHDAVDYLIDRALDIARGGNGMIERKAGAEA